ncbi:hypothetical protein K9M74_03595 [Candidatus Woesearchaeota archaeon]|nr:hypothetical protein [Candidatus Woesearchaeota archaeon]
MATLELLAILTAVFGVMMSVGPYMQAYKIYKHKSAKDVSLLMQGIFFAGTTTWFLYGLMLNDIPIMLSFGIGILGWALSFVLVLKYR